MAITSSAASAATDAGADSVAPSAGFGSAASLLVLQVLTTLSGHDFNHYCWMLKLGLSRTTNNALVVQLSLRLAKILLP